MLNSLLAIEKISFSIFDIFPVKFLDNFFKYSLSTLTPLISILASSSTIGFSKIS